MPTSEPPRWALSWRPAPPLTVASRARPCAALGWVAPGGRAVLGVIVERPVALGAGLEARPAAVLLRCEYGREQPTDRLVRPLAGGEQGDPPVVPGQNTQARRTRSVVERIDGLGVDRVVQVPARPATRRAPPERRSGRSPSRGRAC